MGTIHKRGSVWWIKYHRNGRQFFESSKSHIKRKAELLLKQREGDITKGKTPGIYYDRVTFDDLVKDFLADYKMNKKISEWRAKISVDHLKKYFSGMKAMGIDTAEIRKYINTRLDDKAKAATINRELSALRRAFHLATRLDGMKLSSAAKLVREGIEETLSCMSFPREYWRRIRTNNPMERIMREIRRRTRVVGCFPDGHSALMLVAARLRHIASSKWGTCVYLNMKRLYEESMQEAA